MGAPDRRTPSRELRFRLEDLGAAAGIRALGALPEAAAHAIGDAAGRIAARRWHRYRRIALANLAIAFPEWDEPRREAVLRENLEHLGRTVVEWARLPSLSRDALIERVDVEGLDLFAEALSRKRGVLIATAHYGFWELLLPALRPRIAPYALTAVARAQRNPHLQCRIDARRRIGGDVEPLAQSAFAVRRALRRGLGVGVLADHYLAPRRGGRLVPFLGRRAWTNSGPGALAAASGSPLLLTHTVPLGAGRHRIDIGPEILCPRTGDRRRDADVMTKAMNAAIGGWIRKRPEVWLWYHARFRGSPDVPGADYERARRRH